MLDNALDAPQIQTMRAGETDGVRVDYTDYLRSGETISSITSVTITGESTAVTSASAAVTTAAVTILGNSVTTANALTFTLTATSTATVGSYEATIIAVSSASRTSKRKIGFNVIS
jgi:hypothetical protein